MSDRSNENPILDPGGSIAEQLAAKDAEIERLKDALDRQAAHYGGALSIEKARAEKAERERDLAREGVGLIAERVRADAAEAQLAEKDAEIERLKENKAELREEVGIAEARADRLLAALREVKDNGTHICRIGAEKCPVCIAAAALAEIYGDGRGGEWVNDIDNGELGVLVLTAPLWLPIALLLGLVWCIGWVTRKILNFLT